jgi:four helix bundle protein
MNDDIRVGSGPVDVALPHHRLLAYGVAVELLRLVRAADIRDAKLRDEALRSAKSACLNCAEGAGRVSRADKARAFAIARAEAGEAAAAVEIAAVAGDARAESAREIGRVVHRLVGMLTRLVR